MQTGEAQREGNYGTRTLVVEPGGAEFIPLGERHGTPIQLLWTWTSPNMEFATIFVGVLAVAGFGLSFWAAGVAILVGTLAGGIAHAVLSARGPLFGVHVFERCTFPVLTVLFLIASVVILAKGRPGASHHTVPGGFLLALGATFGYAVGVESVRLGLHPVLPAGCEPGGRRLVGRTWAGRRSHLRGRIRRHGAHLCFMADRLRGA